MPTILMRIASLLHLKSSKKFILTGQSGMFFLLALLTWGRVEAQVNTGIKKAVPDSVIEQRLVELALQGPDMQVTEHQGKVLEYQLKTARNTWTNLLTFSLNYNDQSFKQTQTNATYVYPKYFFGLNVPLGTILSRTPVKTANEAIQIGMLNQETLKRKIKADVLTKYRQYKAQSELIAMETGMMNDVEAALTEAKDKFRKNDLSFEAYNVVQRNRNDEYAKIVNLKLQQEMIKLEIERMIGTNLESVLR